MKSKSFITFFIAMLGTVLEWAEYTCYGYLAFQISELFFPPGNPGINLLKTYGIFAVGYIIRPFGAIVFGHIGDCYGRKIALVGSVFLMGFATLFIGCMPDYQSIGILAPIGLLMCRILQGLAISGEYNGAGIFLIENMHKDRPCFAGACISASACAGMVIGGLAAYFVSLPGSPVWAWRIPFMLGGLSCFISSYARKHITETPEFLKAKAQQKTLPFIEVLKYYKISCLNVAIIAAFMGIFVYIGNIYIVTFFKDVVGLPAHHATFFAIVGEMGAALLIPIMGHIADIHKNPAQHFKVGLLITIIGAPLIFMLSYTGNYFYITIAMMLFAATNSIVSGPVLKLAYDQFPAEIRYTGISVAWSASVAIFGGTSPMVAHYLEQTLNWWLAPSLYISIAAGVALLFFMRSNLQPSYFQSKPILSE